MNKEDDPLIPIPASLPLGDDFRSCWGEGVEAWSILQKLKPVCMVEW